jgi:hypothetical protein
MNLSASNTIDLTGCSIDLTGQKLDYIHPDFDSLLTRWVDSKRNVILCDYEEDSGEMKYLFRKTADIQPEWVTASFLHPGILCGYVAQGPISLDTYLAFHRRVDRCSICTEKNPPPDTYTKKCKHYFHKNCLHTWMNINHSCPVCRTQCNPRDVTFRYFEYLSDDSGGEILSESESDDLLL